MKYIHKKKERKKRKRISAICLFPHLSLPNASLFKYIAHLHINKHIHPFTRTHTHAP